MSMIKHTTENPAGFKLIPPVSHKLKQPKFQCETLSTDQSSKLKSLEMLTKSSCIIKLINGVQVISPLQNNQTKEI
jgi:hypothetical protein